MRINVFSLLNEVFIRAIDDDHNNINGTSSVPATSLEKIEGSFFGSNRVRTVNDMASGELISCHCAIHDFLFQNLEILKCITMQF